MRPVEVAPQFYGEATGTRDILENVFFRLEFDAQGRLRRIFDKSASREVVPAGQRANVFQAFEDQPLDWDAWEIDIFLDEKEIPHEGATSVSVVENGPVRSAVEIVIPLGRSTIRQRVYLYDAVPRIDFETTVDWHERHTFLKVAFPVDVHAPYSTQDIHFANIQRPNRRNTSWEAARFETCAQKWIDLSEGDYGVSLLNDCKYGCDVRGNIMRLSLLRAPTDPDPEADQGTHTFTYSLLPHRGDWRNGTIPAAYGLNLPLVAVETPAGQTTGAGETSFLSVDKSNLVVETVKQAFDGPQTVVRLYEAHNQRGIGTLTFEREIASAEECDLMEENRRPLKFADRRLKFQYKPYEIKTFLLTFK
jgi:alpha-mannosidase